MSSNLRIEEVVSFHFLSVNNVRLQQMLAGHTPPVKKKKYKKLCNRIKKRRFPVQH